MAAENLIAWTVAPAPTWGEAAYRGSASCPHGREHHIVLGGSKEEVARKLREREEGYRAAVGCACTGGAIEVPGR
jgi:hypothetical protein